MTEDINQRLEAAISGQTLPSTHEQDLDAAAMELLEINDSLAKLKLRKEQLEAFICADTTEDVGEQVVAGSQYEMIVYRKEKLSWDSDVIEATLSIPKLPSHIKAKYSVDKKKFDTLDPVEKAELLPALETGVSKPKISLVKK